MEIDLEGFSNILDIGEKITLTQTIQYKLSEIEYSPLLNTYIATKIKEVNILTILLALRYVRIYR